MGYYTELKLSCQLNKDAPLDILEKLSNGQMHDELFMAKFGRVEGLYNVSETPELPIDHPFGKTHRWPQIFNQSTTVFDKARKTLKIECDIKAYEADYEKLIEWLKPYIVSGKAKSRGENMDYWIDLLND
jgi:hypothetical protein